jgi:hypothetical protein
VQAGYADNGSVGSSSGDDYCPKGLNAESGYCVDWKGTRHNTLGEVIGVPQTEENEEEREEEPAYEAPQYEPPQYEAPVYEPPAQE